MRQARRTPLHQVEQLYDFKSAAETLKLGVSTVRRLVFLGQITPVCRLSARAVRIPARAINQYIEEHLSDG